MARPDPQNTLQQDIFLLAKNHYGTGLDQVQAARLIAAYHILIPAEFMKYQDTNYWILKEFVETGIILSSRERHCAFMLDLGRGYFGWQSLEDQSPRLEYQYNLMLGLLGEICTTQVRREDGKNLMPFPIPEPDPNIMKLLEEAAVSNKREEK